MTNNKTLNECSIDTLIKIKTKLIEKWRVFRNNTHAYTPLPTKLITIPKIDTHVQKKSIAESDEQPETG